MTPSRPRGTGRALVTAAAGFLLLDAVLLGVAGVLAGRPVLLWGGGVAAVAAVAVILSWRSQRRRLDTIASERQALADEARNLRDLLRDR